ncbi:MAG: hypothetical protein IIA91_06740 [Chloroflexi bacterium]|nr:hypothetical protein [Chloroflexota bacterium]
MLKFIIAAVALLAVAGGLTYGTLGRGSDSAEAEVRVVRWLNVTVAIPEGSGLIPIQSYWQDDRPVLRVAPSYDTSLGVAIDAMTGEVILERVPPELRTVLDQMLQNITVATLDRSTGPWPYSGEPPNVPREKWGNITFVPPDHAAGFRILLMEADSPDPSTNLYISNGRSYLIINVETGAVEKGIAAEDDKAFARFLTTVEYVGP